MLYFTRSNPNQMVMVPILSYLTKLSWISIITSNNQSFEALVDFGIVGTRFLEQLFMIISDPPRCSEDLKLNYLTFARRALTVHCSVEANPSQHLLFKWAFNGSTPDYIQKVKLTVSV